MRVATFCTLDHGGAGTGTQRRVAALRQEGIDARIYSVCVKSKHSYVYEIPLKKPFSEISEVSDRWKKTAGLALVHKRNFPDFIGSEIFSIPKSIIDFKSLHEIIKSSDVIHLHWVVGLLDYDDFADVVGNKVVVWTLADMNAFTGGCHYSESCEEYTNDCKSCPLIGKNNSLAHQTWLIKFELYRKIQNLHIICPSNWMAERTKRSSLLRDRPIHVIPNPLPIEQFVATRKESARKQLELPTDKTYLLFGADRLDNYRKGFDILVDMLTTLYLQDPKSNIELITFGSNRLNLNFPTHEFGHIQEYEKLAIIYSAADAFIFPSREDNSPLTVGESMLCGTPVIGFDVGNVSDLVTHKYNGYIADYSSATSLLEGIKWLLNERQCNEEEMTERCRSRVISLHNPTLSAKKHINLYNQLLCHTDIPPSNPN